MAERAVGALFEIASGSSKAEAALEQFRAKGSAALAGLQSDFQTLRSGVVEWGAAFNSHVSASAQALGQLQSAADFAFDRFTRGMGSNIALALVYSKSIGDAMNQALKSTAAAIAAESIIQSLRSLGLGFYLLALRDFSGAANAFQSAAIWGTVGGAAAAIGASLPTAGLTSTRSAGATAGSGTRGLGSSTGSNVGPAVARAPGSAGVAAPQNLTVMVVGPAQAAKWLTQVINQGVESQDLRLVASHTKRSAPAAH